MICIKVIKKEVLFYVLIAFTVLQFAQIVAISASMNDRLVEAEISMILSLEKHKSYEIEILNMAEKYPFREEQDVE